MALVGRPELLFLDEPTAGMDPQARRGTWELIRRLRADGVSVVLTTHYLAEAEELADNVVVLHAGRVVAEGSPAELTRANSTGQVRFSARPGLPITELQAALPAGAEVSEPVAGNYLITAEVTPELLAAATSWCAGRQVLAEGLNVERRSLEDVFLALTSEPLTGDAPAGPAVTGRSNCRSAAGRSDDARLRAGRRRRTRTRTMLAAQTPDGAAAAAAQRRAGRR